MGLSYIINNTPIENWGLKAGAIKGAMNGYALSGAWSLPKRLGDTHYDWCGVVEPYVNADDITLDGRDLTLSLVCLTPSAGDLRSAIDAFRNEIPDNFALKHHTLGNFTVGVQSIEIETYNKKWAGLTLKLREPQPVIGAALPQADNGAHGIDGHSWAQLGFVVTSIANTHDMPAWQPLGVTTNPATDAWLAGYRQSQTITIQGTIKGATYADFAAKVGQLQTLISAPGVRTVKYFDGSTFNAFCGGGFDVADVYNFKDEHWGKFTCKLIVV